MMSMINCPECGFVVSDRVTKCPKCRFPIGKYTDKAMPDDENTYVMSDSMFNALRSDMTAAAKKKSLTDIKQIKFYAAVVLVLLVLVVGMIIIFNIADGSDKTSAGLDVQELNIGRIMRLNGEYVARLSSNETQPFVAVVENVPNMLESDRRTRYSLVYMNEGKGTIDSFYPTDEDLKDSSKKFKVAGYCDGYESSSDDIENAEFQFDFFDLDGSDCTECYVDVELTMKNKASGLLYYNVLTSDGYAANRENFLVISDGKAYTQLYITNLLYGTTSMDIEIVPYYFVPAEELSADNYTTDVSFIIKKESLSESETYTGESKIQLKNPQNGVVLYDYEIKCDGINSDRIIRRSDYGYVSNGSCEISTFDYQEEKNDLYQPVYSINYSGYLKWKELS